MCECSAACYRDPPPKKFRRLSLLLLECWQREYDVRPYRNFRFDRLECEERLGREYDHFKDFATVVQFLRSHNLCSVRLVGLPIRSMLHGFVAGLKNVTHIELRMMSLPLRLFEILEATVHVLNVKELILEGTPLNNEQVKCLQAMLIDSQTLLYINVASCGITQYNFVLLADGIHKSTSLIGFNCNRILGGHLTLDSDKIAHTVSSLIWQNKLQEIEMQMCEFIAQDMEVMAEYMHNKCCRLRKLNLSNNKIGPDGAHYLLKAVAASSSLTHLSLNGCGLGTHGGELISQYLSSCYHLIFLDVRYNEITPEAVTMILLTLKKPCKLQKLLLWGNRYNPRTGEVLQRLLTSRVVPQDYIDLTATFDNTIPGYRVIPWRI